jgi:predicted PurR-regulated permease PerM
MTELSSKKLFRIFLWLLGIFILLYLIYLLSDIIIILVISILLAFIFDPLVTMLEQEGFNRLASTLFIFIGVGLFSYLGLSFVIPKFTYQMNQIIETLHVYSLHDQLIKI